MYSNAIGLDPDFASAHALAAWCYVWRKQNGWMADRTVEVGEGVRLARREIGKSDAVALARGGHALGFLIGEIDAAVACVNRALTLNPNLATAW